MPRVGDAPKDAHVQITASVDRIEGAFAVLDAAGVPVQIPRAWLPAGVGEGSGVTITLAPGDASALEDSVRARLAQLTKRGG